MHLAKSFQKLPLWHLLTSLHLCSYTVCLHSSLWMITHFPGNGQDPVLFSSPVSPAASLPILSWHINFSFSAGYFVKHPIFFHLKITLLALFSLNPTYLFPFIENSLRESFIIVLSNFFLNLLQTGIASFTYLLKLFYFRSPMISCW